MDHLMYSLKLILQHFVGILKSIFDVQTGIKNSYDLCARK